MKRAKPLRRKAIPKRPRRGERGSARMAILHRAHGQCEKCGQPIRTNSWEDHHIFFKSHTAKLIQDQLWNRCCLHQGCHFQAHQDNEVRRALESLALARLRAHVGDSAYDQLLRDADGTSGAAIVLAYERFSRRTLADVVGEMRAPESQTFSQNPTDTTAESAL